jgi:hypothetical protein
MELFFHLIITPSHYINSLATLEGGVKRPTFISTLSPVLLNLFFCFFKPVLLASDWQGSIYRQVYYRRQS